jgi:hypothetical protein
MKLTSALLALVLFVPAAASAPAPAPASAAPAAQASDFMTRFRQAMKINATDDMRQLVRKNQGPATEEVRKICRAIAAQGNDRLEAEIAALRTAWKAAFKTDFVDIQYEFFSLMRSETREELRRQNVRYDNTYRTYVPAEAAKDATKLPAIGMQFLEVAMAVEQLGDHYLAAMAWMHYGLCFSEYLRGEGADLTRECEAYKQAVAAFDKVQFQNQNYHDAKARYQALEKLGFGDPSKSEVKPKIGKVETGAPVKPLVTTFEVLPDITSIRRPNYQADAIFPAWNSLYLLGNGSQAKFNTMKESGPTAIREAAAKVSLDQDGDGEGDVAVPMTGGLAPVRVTLGAGETKRDWAFLAIIGGQRDTYQGFDRNLEPGDTWMSIYIAPAGSLLTSIGETPIRIIDDNLDGIYGSAPLQWGHSGTIEDSFQRDVDSIVIGAAKRAVPWTEFLQVGDAWYQMKSERDGTQITATPVELETGTLKVSFKGGYPDYLIVKGFDEFEHAYFDVASVKKGIEVPAGKYELFSGQISKGKRNQLMKACILPAQESMPTWTVMPGETTTMELGGPFELGFEIEQDEETVTVLGRSIHVIGRGRETYQRLWNCTLTPEASERPKGTKKGSKGEKMKIVSSQEELRDKGEEFSWHPFDLILTKKKAGEPSEVQLFVKKNKLFGKLDSPWRE